MDEATYIQSLIAQYLKDNGLKSTLNALEHELDKKFTDSVHDESLESIIKDRINFNDLPQFLSNETNADDSNNNIVNTLDTSNQSQIIKSKNIKLPNWSIKYPNSCQILNLGNLNSLIINSSFFHSIINNQTYYLGLFVTNTKYIFIIDLISNEILLTCYDILNGQPIKIIKGITHTEHLILCDMNGNITSMKFIISNDGNWNLVNSLLSNDSKIKLHRRLITDLKYLNMKSLSSKSSTLLGYFTSIGWDNRICVGKVELINEKIKFTIIGDFKLFTNPTSILIIKDKISNLPLIIVGRLESTLLTIFTISFDKLIELTKLSLNDSEFSTHSFQPMAITEISSSSDNNTIITVATNHIPYMRLITLVVPSLNEIFSNELNKDSTDLENINSILLKLSLNNDNENIESFQSNKPIMRSYIISNFNSLSPQDKYSNAILLSRPKCSGIWIPGDDGKLRGFDLRTGNVIETLNSNDGRAKSAFIGNFGVDSEVIVICGAVDKKICIWKCSS